MQYLTLNNTVEMPILGYGTFQIEETAQCEQCMSEALQLLINEVAPKLAECDGIVLGSPVYYASANGTLISFLDRLFYSASASCDLRMKVGAAVVSARRAGTTATFDELNKYFTINQMPVAASQYWNMVHGYTTEDVYADAEGCQIMRTLGRNMAFLMKSIALGRE